MLWANSMQEVNCSVTHDSSGATYQLRIHISVLSCHLLCHNMRLRGLHQLPTHVQVDTTYSYKSYQCVIRWQEYKATNGYIEGPFFQSAYCESFYWCPRCSKIGCYWLNPDCTARNRSMEANSPQWEKVQNRKRANAAAYEQRRTQKEQKQRKKDLGQSAMEMFGNNITRR